MPMQIFWQYSLVTNYVVSQCWALDISYRISLKSYLIVCFEAAADHVVSPGIRMGDVFRV